ncbi:MAG: cytochrome b [Pseudomonadota bacterium]
MTSYSAPARLLHWTAALLILAMIPVGVIMLQDGLPRTLQNTLFIFHKNIGVFVLLLMVARFAWRAASPAPALPASIPEWQRKASSISHAGLYVLAVIVPLSGYIRVRAGGFPIEWLDAMNVPALVPRSDALAEVAKTIHAVGGMALAALILLHIAAAAQHAVIKRDGIFSRMWPPLGRASADRVADLAAAASDRPNG